MIEENASAQEEIFFHPVAHPPPHLLVRIMILMSLHQMDNYDYIRPPLHRYQRKIIHCEDRQTFMRQIILHLDKSRGCTQHPDRQVSIRSHQVDNNACSKVGNRARTVSGYFAIVNGISHKLTKEIQISMSTVVN
jgi:hypothetical protein